jgi:DNA-binding CsgD family transcriptional regulator
LKVQCDEAQKGNIDRLEKCLQDITSPFLSHLEKYHTSLSPRELEICNLIRDGLTSKQIAGILCTSEATVRAQRKMIRKKLNIANEKISLKAALKKI